MKSHLPSAVCMGAWIMQFQCSVCRCFQPAASTANSRYEMYSFASGNDNSS